MTLQFNGRPRYESYVVILGDVSLLFAGDTRHVSVTYKTVVHDDYREDTVENDIGLIQLLVPVKLNGKLWGVRRHLAAGSRRFRANSWILVWFAAAISPITLPTASDNETTFEGQTATVSGWGTTQCKDGALKQRG